MYSRHLVRHTARERQIVLLGRVKQSTSGDRQNGGVEWSRKVR